MIYPLFTQGVFFLGDTMQIILLSNKFYKDYASCKEILKKENRPYCCLSVYVDGVQFAIPFRHHITHKHCFKTVGDAGLDFTKAVVVTDEKYVSSRQTDVDKLEFAIIKKYEVDITSSFMLYLSKYKKAKDKKDKQRKKSIVEYSALQYFEEYL